MKNISDYDLSCGYIQKEGNFTLEKEHSVYHIKGFDKQEKHVWKSFDKVSDARKELKKLVKENR